MINKKNSGQSSSERKGLFGRTISKSTDAFGNKTRTVSKTRTKNDGTEVSKSRTVRKSGDKKVVTKSKTMSKDIPGSSKRLVESKIKRTESGQGLKNRNVISNKTTSLESGYGKGTNTEVLSRKASEKTGLLGKRKPF